ncbi:MAG: hypothetical protein IJ792_02165, partial [Oscillospiraceae bacterium]|nr:hypothetical protein [Oscillospiraceae bacterium]
RSCRCRFLMGQGQRLLFSFQTCGGFEVKSQVSGGDLLQPVRTLVDSEIIRISAGHADAGF